MEDSSSTKDRVLMPTFIMAFFLCLHVIVFQSSTDRYVFPGSIGFSDGRFCWDAVSIAIGLTLLLTLPKFILCHRYFNVLLVLASILFIYSSLVNRDYGLFRGDRFGDEDRLYRFLTSTTIFVEWIVLCILSLVLVNTATKAPSVFPVIFLCLFIGSLIDLSLKLTRYFDEIVGMDLDENRDADRVFTFSQTGQNIMSFIPDTGAGCLLPGLFGEKRLSEGYQGFNCYPNTISVGTFTIPSAAALIAGAAYTPARINADNSKPISEHLSDAYNR